MRMGAWSMACTLWRQIECYYYCPCKAKRVARDLYTQEGCSPYRVAILPWVQLPLWITLSFALRNMSGVFSTGQSTNNVVTTLTTEGCLWFQDLTVPDPYHLLPVLLVATNLGNIEVCVCVCVCVCVYVYYAACLS